MDERCKQYHSALSRCAELLDNMKDGDPITEVPDFLAVKLKELNATLASQSQAAQPSAWTPLNDVQWMNIVNHDHAYHGYSKDEAVRHAVKLTEARLKANNVAHLAGQSQATRAATQAIALFERMLEAEFGKPRWPSVYDVEQCIKMLKGSAAQEVTQQAAPADILEEIAQSWDGCEYDAVGETLDIGAVLRDQFKKLAPVTQQAAKAETAEQAEGEQANVLPKGASNE